MATQSVSTVKPILSESDDYSDNSIGKPTADLAKSPQHESEYDTASDSGSDGENDYDGEEDDEEDDDLDAPDDDNDTGEIILDLDRLKLEEKRKVDDDEDKRNPQYIPKKGVFYEHDDRTADEPGDEAGNEVEGQEKGEQGSDVDQSKTTESKDSKKLVKKSPANVDRWSHDRFDEREQAPKSRQELVSAYGYDIRNEDGPPRARRRRRYGRGPNKYTRNWEDESAYNKVIGAQQQQRKPRPEDFPALGMRRSKPMRGLRDEKENNYDDRDRDRDRDQGYGNGRPQNSERHRNGERRGRGSRSGKMEYKNQTRNKANDIAHSVSSSSSPTARRRSDRPEMSRNSAERKGNDYEQFTNMPDMAYAQRQHQLQQTSQHPNHSPNVQAIHQQQASQHQMHMPHAPTISHHHQQPQQQHSPPLMQQPLQSQLQQPQHGMMPNVQMGASAPTAQPDKRYSSIRQRSANESQPAIQPLPSYSNEQMPPQQLNQQQPLIVPTNMVPNMSSSTELANTYASPQQMPIQLAPDFAASLSKPPPPLIQSGGNLYYAQAQPEYVAAQVATSQPAAAFPPAAYTQPAPPPTQQTTGQPVNAPPPYIQAAAPAAPGPQPIMNYVPGITPAAPQFPMQYPGFQNYSNVHGITYYPPQQPPTRTVMPTRRPTNAIPILAPPDRDGNKNKGSQGDDSGDGDKPSGTGVAPIGSAEDIDHILDNMFVQRAPYQPPSAAPVKKSESDEAVANNMMENDTDNNSDQSKVPISDHPSIAAEDSSVKQAAEPSESTNASSATSAISTSASAQPDPAN